MASDKASLLAEVLDNVKELKRQTSRATGRSHRRAGTAATDGGRRAGCGGSGRRRRAAHGAHVAFLRGPPGPHPGRHASIAAEVTMLSEHIRSVLLITADGGEREEEGDYDEEEDECVVISHWRHMTLHRVSAGGPSRCHGSQGGEQRHVVVSWWWREHQEAAHELCTAHKNSARCSSVSSSSMLCLHGCVYSHLCEWNSSTPFSAACHDFLILYER
ncbi:hypothetical protein EJB05_51673, partial [Eragrostis curvula]